MMSKLTKNEGLNRHEVCRRFQINGFIFKSDAMNLIMNELANGYPPYESVNDFIGEMCAKLMTHCREESFVIDVKAAQKSIDALKQSRLNKADVNHLIVKNVCHNDRQSNGSMDHYNTLMQHLGEHHLFKTQFKLTVIDKLNTSDESVDCIVFGVLRRDLTKVSTKFFILKDCSGEVPVVFSDHTQWRDAIIVDNSFVLIEGTYESSEDTLFATAIGLPPPPQSLSSQLPNPVHNPVNRMIVIISDIHLDDDQTKEKLKILLTGYNSSLSIPDCFIFTGNFVSQDVTDVCEFKAHMKHFVKLISSFGNIANNSQLLFVPGIRDFNSDNIPIAEFSGDMFPNASSKLRNYYLSTNPVNIYIDGKHICLTAYPLVSKLRKHIIHDSTQSGVDYGTSIAKLIACNAHLTPGLDKKFNSSLSITHLPDLILINDNEIELDIDCTLFNRLNFINMPSFSDREFKFKVIYTNPLQIEDSQILM